MSKKLNEIIKENKLEKFKNEFIHSFMEDFETTWGEKTLEEINQKQKTWNASDMEYGILGLKNSTFYKLYDDDNNLKDIGLIYSKAKNKKTKHFVILLSGGAFGSCCNLAESFPVSRRLNELGIDSFTLTYQTAKKESFVNGLMPKPLEDISNALNFIKAHNNIFDLDLSSYSLIGFSAGAFVTASYALKYQEYQQIKPKGILLTYPLIVLDSIDNDKMKKLFYTGLYGVVNSRKKEKNYNLFKNVGKSYPDTYIVLAKDDDTVPISDPLKFANLLKTFNVNSIYQEASYGGHGFGLGSKTDAKGYIENYLRFIGEYYE